MKIAVIGCGNANRSDDAAGLEVIRLLRARLIDPAVADVMLLDAGTDGMAVMFAAKGCTSLIVVDACRTGSAPGAVYEVPGSELANEAPHTLTLHDFRWDHALYAGRRIFGDNFPRDVLGFLIEAERVELGCGLSRSVAEAAASVALQIEERIAQRRRDHMAAGTGS